MDSKDYHDYVIKDGKFIGEFEAMYQNVDDPWHHGAADIASYDMCLYLLGKYCGKNPKILDIGCGKGAFDGRIKTEFPGAEILGIDISETAITKAKASYNNIDFSVLDIQKEHQAIKGEFDLIIVSNVLWYILYDFKKIMGHLKKNLKKGGPSPRRSGLQPREGGYVLIRQTFYKPGQQKYGADLASTPEQMIGLLDYELVETIELNRQTNHEVIVLLKNT